MNTYMSIVIGIEHSIFDLIINIEGHKQYTKYHTIKTKLLLNLIIKHYTIIIFEFVIAFLHKFFFIELNVPSNLAYLLYLKNKTKYTVYRVLQYTRPVCLSG